MSILNAYLDDFGKITVTIDRSFYQGKSDRFQVVGMGGYFEELTIDGIESHDRYILYRLRGLKEPNFRMDYQVRESHGRYTPLIARLIVKRDQFQRMFDYNKDDLGSFYTPEKTTFRVWAPTAVNITLEMDVDGVIFMQAMEPSEMGTWTTSVNGDYKDATYNYLVERNGEVVKALDPYAYSSNGNGKASAIIDTSKIDEVKDYPLDDHITGVDAIIYECSVRDMTSDPSSGINPGGKFVSLCQENTEYMGLPTGLSYLKSLGITHVQLMPITDFSTVDDFHPEVNYNWGYDPRQFLSLKGSYSTKADDPYARMIEFKKLISCCHKNHLRVNLDVVFNHVYDVDESAFDKIVPYYYFRYNEEGYMSNGSFCGNDFASEMPMASRYLVYVIQSLMRIYHVDGFRFDLMGILDVDTMNQIRYEAMKINPDVMIYGEGWDMPTMLDQDKKANILNQYELAHIGFFNDYFRDVIKGKTSENDKYDQGYATGNLGAGFATLAALTANVLDHPHYKRFTSPDQSINAFETHDNSTVWDKMHACCNNEDRATRIRRQKLMLAITLVSQGIPFIHSGFEFCGTKKDNHNSYNAPDEINRLDYKRMEYYQEVVRYFRKTVALRKSLCEFCLKTADEIAEKVRVWVADDASVFYDIAGSKESDHVVRVIINPSREDRFYHFDEEWKVIFDENGNGIDDVLQQVAVPALSLIVCKR